MRTLTRWIICSKTEIPLVSWNASIVSCGSWLHLININENILVESLNWVNACAWSISLALPSYLYIRRLRMIWAHSKSLWVQVEKTFEKSGKRSDISSKDICLLRIRPKVFKSSWNLNRYLAFMGLKWLKSIPNWTALKLSVYVFSTLFSLSHCEIITNYFQ